MGYVESLLAENEKIVIRTRQHWTVLASALALNGVLWLAIIALAILAATMLQQGGVGIALAVLTLIPVGGLLLSYLRWWNEEYLVTDRRVICANGIVNKHVLDSSLEKVNDVVLDQSVLGRMFDYGDLEILTASESGVNKLRKIAFPVKFKTEMLNQKQHLENGGHAAPSEPPLDIPALIAQLDVLRRQGALTEIEFQAKKAELLSRM